MKRIALAVMMDVLTITVVTSAAQPMPLNGENPTTLKSLLPASAMAAHAAGIKVDAPSPVGSWAGSAFDVTCADGTYKCGSDDNFTCCWNDSQHCYKVSNSDSYYCQTNGDACNR